MMLARLEGELLLDLDIFRTSPSGGRHLKKNEYRVTLTVFGSIRQPYQSLRSSAKIEEGAKGQSSILRYK